MKEKQILAFDWGTTIMGILDLNSNTYKAYRYKDQMVEASKRLINSNGTIISFSQSNRDLKEIAELLDIDSIDALQLNATHDNMAPIVTNIRWPPRDGEKGILGTDLNGNFDYYFESAIITPPEELTDDYEINNWEDCYKAAELWKRWKEGSLVD